MIDLETLKRRVKVFSQEAWRIDNNNTTVNAMIEHIVYKTIELVYDEFNEELDEIKYALEQLEEGQLKNGKDGGHKNAQRYTEASDEGPKQSSPGRGRKSSRSATNADLARL